MIMPLLFSEAGYEVTVCDPPYAGYMVIPDLSIFAGHEGIKAYNTENGQFNDQSDLLSRKQKIWNRNFFCYSIMKVSPLVIQSNLYQGGRYFNTQDLDSLLRETQFTSGISLSHGIEEGFMNSYSVLCALPGITKITDDEQNTFLMMKNETTHDPMLLQEPEYKPEMFVDNTIYDSEHEDRFTFEGRTLLADTPYRMITYHSNMAALLKLGEWFDMLRNEGVYDNTRIIIVADHGHALEQFEDMVFGEWDGKRTEHNPEDVMAYNALLLVKDFDDNGFHVDHQFMTNADTPTLAFGGLIDAPINPFTRKAISAEAKNVNEHHVLYTDTGAPGINKGVSFHEGRWYALEGQNIFNMSAWDSLGYY